MSFMHINSGNKVKVIGVEQHLWTLEVRKYYTFKEGGDQSIDNARDDGNDRVAELNKQCNDDDGDKDDSIAEVGCGLKQIIEERSVKSVDEQHLLSFSDDQRSDE